MFDVEETMITLLGTAVVLAGMTFGVSNANANPCVDNGFCILFDGNGNLDAVSPAKTHIITTPSGNINFYCKTDVTPSSSGTAAHFDFSSTHDFCFNGCAETPLPYRLDHQIPLQGFRRSLTGTHSNDYPPSLQGTRRADRLRRVVA